ncbi:hypothetical protein BT93_K1941 [Corymbia citriodora subsp. variegata]|nr:hypothetical protein BT93_K1941 [Corymbia citriodora subsp. variegata]
MNICVWNIRGLVDPVHQAEARRLVRSYNLCCIGLLETKVPAAHFEALSTGIILGWLWTSNYDFSPRGRIWVKWDPNRVAFDVQIAHGQAIHGKFLEQSFVMSFNLSIIYGEHTFVFRRLLRADLVQMSGSLLNSPWMAAGDSNVIRDPSDQVGGTNTWLPLLMNSKIVSLSLTLKTFTMLVIGILGRTHLGLIGNSGRLIGS